MNALIRFARISCAIVLGILLSSCTFLYVAHKIFTLPDIHEIQSFDNISNDLPRKEQEAIKKSRKSAVRVFSMETTGMLSASTGTYIVANGQYYIVTVSHGIMGPCEEIAIWTEEDGFTECKEIVAIDTEVDYAIIKVDKITSREPIKIPEALPDSSQWKQSLSIQKQVYYTGYPNNAGPVTVDGRIVGVTTGHFIYLHSYAWRGASGSGVFTSDGKFIGVVFAVDVGESEYGPDVFENVVIVVPTFFIDWTTILK
tara:strand:+ start:260 stop:1027 length:768 start_codon:yes stop_codon:yes gene_type:complete